MKTLTSVIQRYPWQSISFAAVFSALATAMACRQEWFVPGLLLYVVLMGLMAGLIVIAGWKTPVAVLLALLVAWPARAREEPEAMPAAGCAAAAVAVVVVAAGGYVVYKLVKFCQKHFPKDEEPSPGTNTLSFDGLDYCAAAFNLDYLGSCAEGWPCSDQVPPSSLTGSSWVPTAFGLRILVLEGPTLSWSVDARQGRGSVQTWAELVADAAAMGLELTGMPSKPSFSRNGAPIDQAASPFSWDPDRRLVKVRGSSRPYYTLEVSRSPNMRSWTHLLRTEVEAGTSVLIQDAEPRGQQFYRFTAILSD